jgi:response regulator RpfG family c-di-GMP phosphodiesterase
MGSYSIAISFKKYTLVILDVIIPEMDGIELYNRLRTIDPSRWRYLSIGFSPIVVAIPVVFKPLLLRTSKIMHRTINLFLSAPYHPMVSLSLCAIPYTPRLLLVLREWELSNRSNESQSFQQSAQGQKNVLGLKIHHL